THALIKNVDRANRASNSSKEKKNADGWIDLYVGPKPPAGQEANWVPTDPVRRFEPMFRLYGPEEGVLRRGPDAARWRKGRRAVIYSGSCRLVRLKLNSSDRLEHYR